MTNNIGAPVTTSLVAPSYQSSAHTATVAQQQQQQNNTIQQPVNTVNPADKPQDTNINLDQDDGEKQQQAALDAVKSWIKNASPLGNSISTVFRDSITKQYMVISTVPETGKIITYALGPQALNPYLQFSLANGINTQA